MTAVNPGPAFAGKANNAAVLVRSNSAAALPFGWFNSELSSIEPVNAVPRWVAIGTVGYNYFAAAATSNTVTLLSLPAGAMIHGVFLYPTAAFSGPSISAYTVSVGISTSTSLLASAFDVTTNGSTNFQLSDNFYAADMANSTTITMTATSTGANLSAANSGMLVVKVLISTLTGS